MLAILSNLTKSQKQKLQGIEQDSNQLGEMILMRMMMVMIIFFKIKYPIIHMTTVIKYQWHPVISQARMIVKISRKSLPKGGLIEQLLWKRIMIQRKK